MDFNLSLDDMILSAYRLSWPAPAAKAETRKGRLRRLLRRAANACRRQRLEGWPVVLSVPASQ